LLWYIKVRNKENSAFSGAPDGGTSRWALSACTCADFVGDAQNGDEKADGENDATNPRQRLGQLVPLEAIPLAEVDEVGEGVPPQFLVGVQHSNVPPVDLQKPYLFN
jgi:hypothetical protein